MTFEGTSPEVDEPEFDGDEGDVSSEPEVELAVGPAAPMSTATPEAELEEIMAVTRAAADAQKDLEAAGEDPFAPADQVEQDEGEGEPQYERGESERAEERGYSRRDAPRLARELESTRGQLAQAQAILRQVQARDSSIMSQIVQQAGSEQEFEQLRNLVRRSPEQQQRYETMVQWRQVAGPIYEAAQQQVVQAWGEAFRAAANLGGMTDHAHRQIMAATDPKQALELIHQAGQRTAEQQITRLKAEISSLRSRTAAVSPQPAVPEGIGAAANGKLPPMLLEDGITLNPEFEKLASSGKLYGVERLRD